MYNTGSSFRKTAAHFNIPSYSTVRSWRQIYNNKGAEFLYEEHRGRIKKNMSRKLKKVNKNINDNSGLLKEIEQLKM